MVAVGGYGRGELAPSSDIDLLFLRPYKRTPHVEQLAEFMLYRLWDLGLKVGHASRSVEECMKLAQEPTSPSAPRILEAPLRLGLTGAVYEELRRALPRARS